MTSIKKMSAENFAGRSWSKHLFHTGVLPTFSLMVRYVGNHCFVGQHICFVFIKYNYQLLVFTKMFLWYFKFYMSICVWPNSLNCEFGIPVITGVVPHTSVAFCQKIFNGFLIYFLSSIIGKLNQKRINVYVTALQLATWFSRWFYTCFYYSHMYLNKFIIYIP